MTGTELYSKLPKKLIEAWESSDRPLPSGSQATWLEEDVMIGAANASNIPYLALNTTMVEIDGLRRAGYDICERLQAIPLFSHDTLMVFACVEPWEQRIIAELRQELHVEIIPIACTESTFQVVLAHLRAIELKAPKEEEKAYALTHLTTTGWAAPSLHGSNDTDLVKTIMRRAYEVGASDIHIEPFATQLNIRFRIDGELVVMPPIEIKHRQKVIDDFKLLSHMKVSDHVTLKDGRISLPVTNKKDLDLRVVSVPTIGGTEGLVLRLLDPDSVSKNVGKLPFEGEALKLVNFCLSKPNGMIIITGPTGSGKTTTLYKCLNSMDISRMKIITIEDPVEYTIKGVTQIQVDRDNDVTFSSTLKKGLRMDPDVMLVGEMRDEETAGLGIEAALTGHLVLTTLHTNDSVASIPRLKDLGVTNQLIKSTLLLVIAQRLMGKLCTCKEGYDPDALIVRHFERWNITAPQTIYRHKGCEHCNFTGIVGRVPIFEFMHASKQIGDAIVKDAPEMENDLRNICTQQRHLPLIHHALELAATGIVAYEEAAMWETEYIQ